MTTVSPVREQLSSWNRGGNEIEGSIRTFLRIFSSQAGFDTFHDKFRKKGHGVLDCVVGAQFLGAECIYRYENKRDQFQAIPMSISNFKVVQASRIPQMSQIGNNNKGFNKNNLSRLPVEDTKKHGMSGASSEIL